MEQIFSPRPLSSRAEKEHDYKKNTSIYGQNADLLQSANYKKRVDDETKNNGQWVERRKKTPADCGRERSTQKKK